MEEELITIFFASKKEELNSMKELSISKNEQQFINEALQEAVTMIVPTVEKKDVQRKVVENGNVRMETHQQTILQKEERVVNRDQSHKIRVDGRGPFDFRDIKIEFEQMPQSSGQLWISLGGQTKVYASIFCSVIEPLPERPTDGFLTFNVEMSSMASPFINEMNSFSGNNILNRKSEMAIEVGRIIERAIKGSRAIDTEALCIISGKKVWSIRVDIHLIDFYGNIMDCAHLAAVTSLLHFKRPDISIEGEEVIIHSIEERDPVPLSVHHIPICVTFGFLNDETVLLDTSLKEELMCEGNMTIAMNIYDEICAIQKAGGIPLHLDQILKCNQIARIKVKEITAIVKQALQKDEQYRKSLKVIQYKYNPTVRTVRELEKQKQQQQEIKQEEEIDDDIDNLSDMSDEDSDNESASAVSNVLPSKPSNKQGTAPVEEEKKEKSIPRMKPTTLQQSKTALKDTSTKELSAALKKK